MLWSVTPFPQELLLMIWSLAQVNMTPSSSLYLRSGTDTMESTSRSYPTTFALI